MICGNCKHPHSSVGMVKACYRDNPQGGTKVALLERPAPIVSSVKMTFMEFAAAHEFWDGELSVDEQRRLYQEYLGPAEPVKKLDFSMIPASNYALSGPDGLEFYRVTVGSGRWDGMRFVERLIGAPGTWRRVKLNKGAQLDVLRRLIGDSLLETTGSYQGPVAAAVRYGREFTACAKCSSPLSDPKSLELGIGPVCLTRFV